MPWAGPAVCAGDGPALVATPDQWRRRGRPQSKAWSGTASVYRDRGRALQYAAPWRSRSGNCRHLRSWIAAPTAIQGATIPRCHPGFRRLPHQSIDLESRRGHRGVWLPAARAPIAVRCSSRGRLSETASGCSWLFHRRFRRPTQHDVIPVTERPFGGGQGEIEDRDHPHTRALVGHRIEDRIQGQ